MASAIRRLRLHLRRITANDRGNSHFEVISSGVVGNTIYLELLVEGTDGTMVPTANVLEVENGVIRRGRVYLADVVVDDVSMDEFAASRFADR